MSSTTYRIRLRLTMESEASIRDSLPARNIYLSEEYVGPTKVRGALLNAIRSEICPYGPTHHCVTCAERDTCQFTQGILTGFIKASAALPYCKCDDPIPIARAPATFSTCKICSEKKAFDGTKEILVDQTIQNVRFCDNHNEPYFRVAYRGPICLKCNRPLLTPNKMMRPAVEINNYTNSAREGQLFFTETISYDNTYLQVDLIVKEELIERIQSLTDDQHLIQFGAGRGRGWGMVRVKSIVSETDVEKVIDSIVPTVEKMLEDKNIIIIGTSPIASLDTTNESFQSVPRVERIDGLQLVRGYGRTISTSGWSLRANLQRPRLTAADVGSVFLYRPEQSNISAREVARLEIEGIGDHIMRNTQLNHIVFWRGYE